MSSIRSPNNYSVSPLGPNNIYIGNWDSCLNYATGIITVYASTNCELTIVQSVDKLTLITETFAITAAVPFTKTLTLQYPYLKSTLRNLTASTQTYLNYEVIYREASVSTVGPEPLDVNISDSTGNAIVSTAGKLQVQDILAENTLTAISNKLSANRGSNILWATSGVPPGGASASVNLSNVQPSTLTFYGNSNQATTFTLQFSNTGSVWYTSQYSYTLTVAGDWGFAVLASPNYVRLITSAGADINAILNWS